MINRRLPFQPALMHSLLRHYLNQLLPSIGLVMTLTCSTTVLIGGDVNVSNKGEPKSGDTFKMVIKEQPPKKHPKDGLWVLGHLHVHKTDKKETVRAHQILEIVMNRKDVHYAQFGVHRPDFNCDGYPDIEILQHEGSKWGYAHLWLFDPEKDKFYTNEITRQFSKIAHASYRIDSKTKLIHVKKFHGAELSESVYQINQQGLQKLSEKSL